LRVRFLLVACGLALLATRCGSPESIPFMSIFASPRTIDDRGAVSTVSVSVTDDEKKARTGTVSLTAAAGSFEGAGNTASVELSTEGTGEVAYSCLKSADPNCQGAVKLEARWSQGEEFLVQVLRVEVVPFDAGVPDGGVRDGGP
jgi:hypothetical protein